MFKPWEPYRQNTGPYRDSTWDPASLAPWVEKWHRLSPQARQVFATQIKSRRNNGARTPIRQPPDRFSPEVLKELSSAGLVELGTLGKKEVPNVVVPDPALMFAHVVHSLHNYHLLREDQPPPLKNYLNQRFDKYSLLQKIRQILRAQNMEPINAYEDELLKYVVSRHWPEWVAGHLKDVVLQRILEVLQREKEALTLAELRQRLPQIAPAEVQKGVDQLIAHAAVFEDLHPQTMELVVGLLAGVRQDMARATQPQKRPRLVVCRQFEDRAPAGGWLINSLRAFLLELVNEPPRLCQNGTLFQKEEPRLRETLEPLPVWLAPSLHPDAEMHLDEVIRWAAQIGLTRSSRETGVKRLEPSQRGQKWLAKDLWEQTIWIYKWFNRLDQREQSVPYYSPSGDHLFLGSSVYVVSATQKQPQLMWWTEDKEQYQALRQALHQAFAVLSPGVPYQMSSVLQHLAFGPHNPLLLGRDLRQVRIRFNQRFLPPLEEEVEKTATEVLNTFITTRLIPLGAVEAGVDASGQLCLVRLPQMDAYFGQEVPKSDVPLPVRADSRVIVQPDFTITIIGLDPAPLVELLPFCERLKGRAGEGAVVLRITREAIVKAVGHGLSGEEILRRLQQHASKEMPANVLHEVREWSAWVRQVPYGWSLVFRCPDADTANRLAAVLRGKVERLGETALALTTDTENLPMAVRNKLLENGLIVQGK